MTSWQEDLRSLRFHWGRAYEITRTAGMFRATRRDDGGVICTLTAKQLTAAIRSDYQARPVRRPLGPDDGMSLDPLSALLRDFATWQIERFAYSETWVAVTHRGTCTHVLAAHGLDDLRAKLEKAAAEDG